LQASQASEKSRTRPHRGEHANTTIVVSGTGSSCPP
jgi:hypothetical protein